MGDFDARIGWAGHGVRSCAHWLSWKCGIGLVAARDKVRVARALPKLPRISEAMRQGKLSYSKVRAITHQEDDSAEARGAAASASPASEPGIHQEDDSAEAPADETTWAQRQADALALCAETFLAAGPRALAAGDRHLVNVHVDLDALVDPEAEGKSALDAGPRIPPDTVRRLACDGSLVTLLEDGLGRPLDVGRKTRAIPPAMRRALQHRDGGCRFPGCTATRHVDGHHIQHWANGGPTNLENLVLLCPFHHRLVHEGGFHVERAEHGLRFLRPDRTPIHAAPRAAAPRAPDLAVAITPQTAVPGWGGERMDLGYCLTALAQREARASA